VREAPQFRGGFADVWKGQSDGRDVAVKILRVYPSSGYEQIIKVGYPILVVFINELTTSHAEVLQGGHDMEDASSSERAAVVRRGNNRDSVCDGIRVDEEWDHQ